MWTGQWKDMGAIGQAASAVPLPTNGIGCSTAQMALQYCDLFTIEAMQQILLASMVLVYYQQILAAHRANR